MRKILVALALVLVALDANAGSSPRNRATIIERTSDLPWLGWVPFSAPPLYRMKSRAAGMALPVVEVIRRFSVSEAFADMVGAGGVGITIGARWALRPVSWADSFTEIWRMEDGGVGTGFLGNYNLTVNGDAASAAGPGAAREPIDGAKVLDLDGNEDFLSIADADAGDLDKSGTGTFSGGCWTYFNAEQSGYSEMIIKHNTGTQQLSGFILYKRGLNPPNMRAMIGNGSASIYAPSLTSTSSWTGYWRFVAMHVYGHATSGYVRVCQTSPTLQCGTSANSNTVVANDSNPFSLGSWNNCGVAGDCQLDGYLEECFFDHNRGIGAFATGESDVCRICSLGIFGQRGECDPATPANFKPCVTNADCIDSLCVIEAAQADEDECVSSGNGTDGCCMGYNQWNETSPVTGAGLDCGGCDLQPCNSTRSSDAEGPEGEGGGGEPPVGETTTTTFPPDWYDNGIGAIDDETRLRG